MLLRVLSSSSLVTAATGTTAMSEVQEKVPVTEVLEEDDEFEVSRDLCRLRENTIDICL